MVQHNQMVGAAAAAIVAVALRRRQHAKVRSGQLDCTIVCIRWMAGKLLMCDVFASSQEFH